MIEIIPALMPKSFGDLKAHLEQVRGIVRTVQIDVMDGQYVPGKSWPYAGDRELFDRIAVQSEGMPYWEQFNFEIDLMVEAVLQDAERFIAAGAARIVIHIEHEEAVAALKTIVSLEGAPVGERAVEIGVAVSPDTTLSKLDPVISQVDFIQCMGIRTIGAQGEPFDSRVLLMLSALREMYPHRILSVDGAVNADTIPELVASGATRLVVGSAIWNAQSPRNALAELRSLA